MRVGLYYREKFIELDPTQLKKGERAFVLLDDAEVEFERNEVAKAQNKKLEEVHIPSCYIIEKTDEFKHESGAIIHRHIQKPASPRVEKVIRSHKEIIKAPKDLKGLKHIIHHIW